MQRSIVVAAGIDETFDRVMGDDLTGFFDRGHLAFPAVVGTDVLAGDGRWGTSTEQRRHVLLADGSTMTEQVVEVDAPHVSGYVLTELPPAFALVIEAVRGEWRFEEADGGTRVTWTWRLRPRTVAGRAAVPVLAWMWQGYAAKALDRIRTALQS